jgi:hypothetical protein|tara:strand:- start:12720 stop:13556 length:837 start_codon:yes stop_codon:yes gene_type:complete
MSQWQQEWDKFSENAIQDMKRYSDNTNEQKEWMCYVYDVDGVYQLGEPSYGGRSRIEVSPEKKGAEDKAKNGFDEIQRKWTIHGHPLKDGKIYTGRQYFSSTDICREFVKCRDTDERVVQFLVYPHSQVDTTTNRNVMHNRCRVLIFPNQETIMRAMQDSNPQADANLISVDTATNQSVKLEDGSTTLKNELNIDWFKFQESLGSMGFMGIVDIEGPQSGSDSFKSETIMDGKNLLGIGLMLTIGGIVLSRIFNIRKSMFGAEVIEGYGAECQGYHFD